MFYTMTDVQSNDSHVYRNCQTIIPQRLRPVMDRGYGIIQFGPNTGLVPVYYTCSVLIVNVDVYPELNIWQIKNLAFTVIDQSL